MIKRSSRILAVLVLLTMVIGLASGCSGTATTAATTAAPAVTTAAAETTAAPAAEKIRIALIPKVAVPFFDDCNNGGKAAAEALGVDYQWIAPADTQGATQVKIIEDLISKQVSGIGISVNEPKSVEDIIKKAVAAGIKVVTYDSDSPNSGRSMYIGTSNKAAGKTMGEEMAKACGGKGTVAIVTGQLGAVNLNERIDGIKEALAAYPDMKIVDLQGTEDDLAKAVTVTENIFRSKPDLVGIFGVSQVGGPAIAKVLSEQEFSNLKGKVTVLAFDDLADTIKGIQDGYITAMMVQRPVTMGQLSVENLVKQINGEASAGDIDTGVTVVTKDNLTTYTK